MKIEKVGKKESKIDVINIFVLNAIHTQFNN